ncbi:hypothetical protein FHX82_000385 [Amycolatopsis bartoniae]|uniref:Uncharacterized protein n=1 Tax=Amycolatopsis bartoniae TaxID=941986 RepID=A0A8H9MAN8_9PSEU|nr:hypothetical protein [Amycolatopsis bartoniae]MBB2933365.1 hypothetical protein [Amycolatopsis bartoniae]TVT08033.1 hypothetical protein FNH07_13710 [Amycolatopsis bartoniae]GHF58972.1 hypothetical protein GCM10017566_35490 [Amycolatopsis bartoniae]
MHPAPDLRAYLRTLDAETLAELLHAEAERNPELRRELERRAAAAAKAGPALDMLQRLLDAGTQADLTPLARRTLDRLEHATTAERRRAIALYARACATHPPDAVLLVDWILGVAFHRPDWPEPRIADFAGALGERGLDRLKSTVDRVLAERAGPRRNVARRLAEQLAEVTGDVDTLLTLLAEEAPTPEVDLRIVRVLRAAGRHGEAVAHAARTLVHRDRPQGGLLALRRAEFRRNPDTATYSALRQAAGERWPEERAAALAALEPADAIPLYRLYVEELIAQKDVSRYQEAVRVLKELRGLHRRTETPDEFTHYLADLLERHRRKTRLVVEIRNARFAMPKAGTHRKADTMSA